MRVLVATDAIGRSSSAQAGAIIARSWAETSPGTQLAVVPVGEAGAGFLTALGDVHGVETTVAGDGASLSLSVRAAAVLGVGLVAGPATAASSDPRRVDLTASSSALGVAVASALAADPGTPPATLLIDLGGLASHDGGAGLLAALGATADVPLTEGVAGLAGLSRLDLDPVRARLAGVRVVGVIPHDEQDRVLLGLRGITSRLRTPDSDPAEMLAVDGHLASLARLTGDEGTARAGRPGAGAAGGAAYAVLALGGELTTGTSFLGELVGLDDTLRRSDLLVTGCSVFDFATRGGGVVAQLARRSETSLRPCVAIAGEVLIGGREMRTMGVESAYAVRESHRDGDAARPDLGEVSPAELAETARRVARTWSW